MLASKVGEAFLTPSGAPSRPPGGGGVGGGIFGLPAGRGGVTPDVPAWAALRG